MPFAPYPLIFEPGIQRDGTDFAHKAYNDGVWCRFQRGFPRKIGGYKTHSQLMSGISRGLHSWTLSGLSYIHSGFNNGIEVFQVDQLGNTTVPTARTPAGFTNSPNNVWQLTSYYDTASNTQQLLAFQIPALMDISYGATTGNLYAGQITATTALTAVSSLAADATGGVVVIPPYSVVYGSNGLVQWSAPGTPLNFTATGSGAARVTDQKIVRGLPLRSGGSYSPACLLWSLNSVIMMYFTGTPTIFSFNILSDNSSILSHNSVVEVEGVFYWMGIDRFLKYNGVLQEVENNRNINFFFDNINRPYAQKAFAVRDPRYGEIWFCAPLFNATEPNWAVIYNHRENVWYDTPLPNSGRSFGVQHDIMTGVLFSGVDVYSGTGNTYRLWHHGADFAGYDSTDGSSISAIQSYFTTGLISATTFQQPLDKSIHIDTLEPDFIQSGAMSVTPFTRSNPRGSYLTGNTQTMSIPPATSQDQQIPLRVSGRQIKLQFNSNVVGGNYQAGRHIANIEADQGRRTQ